MKFHVCGLFFSISSSNKCPKFGLLQITLVLKLYQEVLQQTKVLQRSEFKNTVLFESEIEFLSLLWRCLKL
jgi:hypothetical protein